MRKLFFLLLIFTFGYLSAFGETTSSSKHHTPVATAKQKLNKESLNKGNLNLIELQLNYESNDQGNIEVLTQMLEEAKNKSLQVGLDKYQTIDSPNIIVSFFNLPPRTFLVATKSDSYKKAYPQGDFYYL